MVMGYTEKRSNSYQGLRISVSEGRDHIWSGLVIPERPALSVTPKATWEVLRATSHLFSALIEGEQMLRLDMSLVGVGNMAHSFPGV